MKRGEIYWADLSPVVGSEQGGRRPALIIQNDTGNKHSPTTIIAIITSRNTKAKLPTHYWIKDNQKAGLSVPSMVEFEQIRTIDKTRLGQRIGKLPPEEMQALEWNLMVSLGL